MHAENSKLFCKVICGSMSSSSKEERSSTATLSTPCIWRVSVMRKRHSTEISTSKQSSWYQNFLPQCGTHIADTSVDLAGIIVRSTSNKSWLSKNIPSLENRNFSPSCWHPRVSGLSRVTTWSPTDGTHMPCESALKAKIKHVKRKLDTSCIEHKSAHLKRRESNIPTLNCYVVVCSSPKKQHKMLYELFISPAPRTLMCTLLLSRLISLILWD